MATEPNAAFAAGTSAHATKLCTNPDTPIGKTDFMKSWPNIVRAEQKSVLGQRTGFITFVSQQLSGEKRSHGSVGNVSAI